MGACKGGWNKIWNWKACIMCRPKKYVGSAAEMISMLQLAVHKVLVTPMEAKAVVMKVKFVIGRKYVKINSMMG